MFRHLTTALLLALAPIWALAASIDAEPAPPSHLLVQVHADWCGSCKVLDPRVQAMGEQLDAADVLVVKLDYTNAATTRAANRLASALGITEAVAANNGTGKLLVIDGDSRTLTQVLTRGNNDRQILAAVGAE